MDLSLLSDDEIRDVDARIRAFWARPLRCTLGVVGEYAAPVRGTMRLRAVGDALHVLWDDAEIGALLLIEPDALEGIPEGPRTRERTPKESVPLVCTPRSADKAWAAWRAHIQRVFISADGLRRPPSAARGPYAVVGDFGAADHAWLACETLTPTSRERLRRAIVQ